MIFNDNLTEIVIISLLIIIKKLTINDLYWCVLVVSVEIPEALLVHPLLSDPDKLFNKLIKLFF